MRATNDAGSDEATSEPFIAVQPGEPRWAERLAIAGDLVEAGEAEADLAGLRGTAPFEMTYQWVRCDETCDAIEGATEARYEPVTADVGARLRLVATAENEWGEARSRSQLSAPVEPAAAEAGPPRSAERPRLEGLPRVTETVGSTPGEWRGAAPISKAIQWQRCGATAESCSDISGATEAQYEVDPADEGRRLRTVVVATNESGRTTAVSLLSPPMKPAVNTAFVLDEAVALADVAAGIEAARALVMSVDYDGPSVGGYSTGAYGDEVEAVLDFFDAPWNLAGLELPITRFTLAGDVATEALGELAAHVDARVEVPSLKVESSEPELLLLSEEEEGEPLVDEYVSAARVWAYGADCDYPCDEADWERWWPQSDILAFPRVIDVSFTWRPTRDLSQRILEEERGFAWEFDLKLYNGENTGLVPWWGIACMPWDTNDFWIADRDDALVDSTMPSEVGLYWDTDATDSCDEKDLTFGVYHPEVLAYGHTYQVKIYLASAGDEEQSTVSWTSQMLERRLTFAGFDCDGSPWCVNVQPFNTVREGKTLIAADLGFSFPGCYEYNDRMRESAAKCLFPE